jgi:hypothetical protein
MVCLDASTNKAKAINPLLPTTDDEKALYHMGEGNHLIRILYGT